MRLRLGRGPRAAGARAPGVRALAGALPGPLVGRGPGRRPAAAAKLRVGGAGRPRAGLAVLVALGGRLRLAQAPRGGRRRRAAARARLRRRAVRDGRRRRLVPAV